ncbi:site-2 protease family protein [Streptobacillus felis]|uniref:Site-2 protease family protein n=1 Tax=Streptobacillus felis TaxID=1384509 RepID=A0A7Z0PFU9_9FUSO|nr:site-2 protease family protein [Streptobacillus felis]NYV27310.1 site-2 protease family protein [Streptobacillus felis]
MFFIVIVTLLVLSLIIFLHEFGHFYTAKKFNMPVSEFSIGMGPLIYSKLKNGTQYSLRAVPIGGYVLIDGMVEASKEDKEFKDYTDEEIIEYNSKGFMSHSKLEKIIVLLAGVIMNFITALIAFVILMLITGQPIINAFYMFAKVFGATFMGLKMLLTGAAKAKEMVGPVGLPLVFAEQIKTQGYLVLIPLFSLLSINIGILNLLPIPALDGGRIIFVLLEFFGIKLNKKLEERIHTIGMILLLLLMVFVLFNDVKKYIF